MNSYMKQKIIHMPRLDTVLMVEDTVKKLDYYPTKNQLWRALPKMVMWQTFTVIIDYLEKSNKIIIDKSCEKLDNQLMNGLWNKRRTDFDRSRDLGHCDLLACLNYLYKEIRWGENVAPTAEMGWKEGICLNPAIPASAGGMLVNEQEAVLQSIFGKSRFLGRHKKW